MAIAPVVTPEPASAEDFDLCHEGRRVTCVVDGDTFWLNGEKVRVLNIDAPEISEPKCAEERRLAEKAAVRLTALLNAGAVALERNGTDRYGRTLALVLVEEVDIGAELVAEGLARTWAGSRKPWC